MRIKFISIEELMEMIENKDKFKLVEVLDKKVYSSGHIPNAINLPVDELEKRAKNELKKDELIVVYCASYHCHASTNAVKILQSLGYKKVLDFKAGRAGWENAGLEFEK